MNKTKKSPKLRLDRQNVRVLTPTQIARAGGGLRAGGGGCCVYGTELMSPATQPAPQPGGCCIDATELMSPVTA